MSHGRHRGSIATLRDEKAARPDVRAPETTTAHVAIDGFPPIPKEQLYEKISNALIEQVSVGTLVPGQRLPPERELARALGVSRPSLREALGALQMLRVIETRHGSGSWVAPNALDVLKNRLQGALDLGVSPVTLLEAREVIEPAIAALAAMRFSPDPEIDRLLQMMDHARDWENAVHRATWSDADRLFHRQIAVQAENPVFFTAAEFIASVQAQQLWRSLRDDTFLVPGRIARAIGEHKRIFEAISQGRPEEAAAAACDHLRAVRDSMGLE
jgi:DNA-binding FadR family transcriptional regulator